MLIVVVDVLYLADLFFLDNYGHSIPCLGWGVSFFLFWMCLPVKLCSLLTS